MELYSGYYSAESIIDFDMADALNPKYNPKMDGIPVDENGFQLGTFVVRVEWIPLEPD